MESANFINKRYRWQSMENKGTTMKNIERDGQQIYFTDR